MYCRLTCKTKLKKLFFKDLPTFSQAGFSKVSNHIDYKFCNSCGAIFNLKFFKKESNKFSQKKFLNSAQTLSSIKKIKNKNIYRFELQTRVITKFLKKKTQLNILDYGCFDGKLLLEMNKKLSNSFFYGVEASKSFKKIFPKKKNFFFNSDINKIKNIKFDLIVFSESIYYLDNINKVIDKVRQLLKPDGFLYIQNTNLTKNPYYLLMSDQYFFAFDSVIKHLMNVKKFKLLKDNFKELDKQNGYLYKKSEKMKFIKPKNENFLLKYKGFLKKIHEDKKKIKKNKNLIKYIFGTTVNAAFMDEILKKKDNIFLDENYMKIKKGFRGKKVISPKNIANKETIILNYGANNNIYKNLLKNIYNLKTKCI